MRAAHDILTGTVVKRRRGSLDDAAFDSATLFYIVILIKTVKIVEILVGSSSLKPSSRSCVLGIIEEKCSVFVTPGPIQVSGITTQKLALEILTQCSPL